MSSIRLPSVKLVLGRGRASSWDIARLNNRPLAHIYSDNHGRTSTRTSHGCIAADVVGLIPTSAELLQISSILVVTLPSQPLVQLGIAGEMANI